MSDIQKELQAIKDAIYGEEVRTSIHDAIRTCYEDGKAGAIDLDAREQIENVCGADAYSSVTNYVVNDRCLHNNKLWKCIVNCNGVEPPNATYWKEDNITDDIDTLNDTLTNVETKNGTVSISGATIVTQKIGKVCQTNVSIPIGTNMTNGISVGSVSTDCKPSNLIHTVIPTTYGLSSIVISGFMYGFAYIGTNGEIKVGGLNGNIPAQKIELSFTYVCA